ncbi:long-chain-fatty-acyl-CoA reductase [Enterobacter rongchengensis]
MIPMPQNFDALSYRVGNAQVLAQMAHIKPRVPFDDEILEFLQTFSRTLLALAQSREFSDVVSLAFWCRKSALRQMKETYASDGILMGRGVVFHIAPSNVAVNFAYSLLAGLLTGNANIVRLPSKKFIQVNIICQALNQALEEHVAMRELICLVEYNHEDEITQAISAACQARLIWGGDRTIAHIRKFPLPARAVDIAFADRYSICVINADYYLAAENKMRIAEDFFNDTLLTQQQACTAPKLVVWTGEKDRKAAAREQFWLIFDRWLCGRPAPEAVAVVNALANYCRYAAEDPRLKYIAAPTRRFLRAEATAVSQRMLEDHRGDGLFYEWLVDDILEIVPVCGVKCQTLATLGVPEEMINRLIFRGAPKGIDRIVPLGQTMNFSLHWDGYDLLKMLTKTLAFKRG